jgi:hypothetical protein
MTVQKIAGGTWTDDDVSQVISCLESSLSHKVPEVQQRDDTAMMDMEVDVEVGTTFPSGEVPMVVPAFHQDAGPVVVIDGANVARRSFSTVSPPPFSWEQLAKTCIFFAQRGFRPVCIVTDSDYLRTSSASATGSAGAARELLIQQNWIMRTPSRGHDDYFAIDYAVSKRARLVTNDKFRDHIARVGPERGAELQQWINDNVVSFTFDPLGDFVPNPEAGFGLL